MSRSYTEVAIEDEGLFNYGPFLELLAFCAGIETQFLQHKKAEHVC